MRQTTIRISDAARDTLREIAKAEGKPMQAVLEEAVEILRRKRFLEEVNAAYASLRGDANAWAEMERERRDWDSTLMDGLVVREGRAAYRSRRASPIRRRKT